MEAVDGVWDTELGLEEGLDFGSVAEVGLFGNAFAGTLGDFWLDNVGKDEVDIWGLFVFEELAGEL